jgi:hypothetical protein
VVSIGFTLSPFRVVPTASDSHALGSMHDGADHDIARVVFHSRTFLNADALCISMWSARLPRCPTLLFEAKEPGL